MTSAAFLSGSQLSSSSCLDARHLTSSLYATGAFQTATLVLELRRSECKSVCGFFKRNCLGLQKFFPPIPHILALESWARVLGVGLGYS